ncbi:MAG: dimethyl sulfoxide reductase anchor subunit [Lachnospiraceae bacterium]|nr:dimethyl sulfoxide reductase anchor subunit [Lachnospiraceae bacterium]
MGHTSLILGTVFSQLAIGTFITGYVIDQWLKKANEKNAFITTCVSFVAGCIGLAAIITHLGVPMHAFNAFLNIGSSWLSRETLFSAIFMLLLFVYLLIQKGIIAKESKSALKGLGCVTAICGLCLAFVTAMIYMIPGVPAWNTAATPVSFMLSAFLTGIPLGVYLSGYDEAKMPALLTGLIALCALFVALIHVTSLQAGASAQAASGYLMSSNSMFAFRMVLLALAAACGLYFGIRGTKQNSEGTETKTQGGTIFLLLFLVLIVAEFLGRYLFFGTIVRL